MPEPEPHRETAPEMIPAFVDGQLRPVEKLRVHRLGLRHLAVSVFVTRGRQILLQQRALGKYHTPGLWANTCCTHPHWEEAPDVCAARRLWQELGINGLVLRHAGIVEYRADVSGGLTEHEVVDIFIAEAPADLTLALNPDEVIAARWVDIDDLAAEVVSDPARFTPWLRIYLADHRLMIFGALSAMAG
jgi:isopentenyl-diphosphate Delta-isomerase